MRPPVFTSQLFTMPTAPARPCQRGRLTQIRDNLLDRITEAETNRWFGEAEGLKVSLAGAQDKLAQIGPITARRDTAINLGIPTFTEAAGRATDPPVPANPLDSQPLSPAIAWSLASSEKTPETHGTLPTCCGWIRSSRSGCRALSRRPRGTWCGPGRMSAGI